MTGHGPEKLLEVDNGLSHGLGEGCVLSSCHANGYPEQFGFAIEYTDAMGNLRYYETDFVAVTTEETHYLIETRGLEEVNVAKKDRAAGLWCENATSLTGKPWAYVKVQQAEYNSLQPTLFSDVLVLASR